MDSDVSSQKQWVNCRAAIRVFSYDHLKKTMTHVQISCFVQLRVDDTNTYKCSSQEKQQIQRSWKHLMFDILLESIAK